MRSDRAHDIPWNGGVKDTQDGLSTELPKELPIPFQDEQPGFSGKVPLFLPNFLPKSSQDVHSPPAPGGISGAAPCFFSELLPG